MRALYAFAREEPLVVLNSSLVSLQIPIHTFDPLLSASSHRARAKQQLFCLLHQLELLRAKDQREQQYAAARNLNKLDDDTFLAPASKRTDELESVSKRLVALGATLSRGGLQEFFAKKRLALVFPRSAAHFNFSVEEDTSVPDFSATLSYLTSLNQVLTMSRQLRADVSLTNHKYIAHQIALLYQFLTHFGKKFIHFKARIEEQFDAIKAITGDGSPDSEPQMSKEQKDWLFVLTTDIISEVAEFRGAHASPMSSLASMFGKS